MKQSNLLYPLHLSRFTLVFCSLLFMLCSCPFLTFSPQYHHKQSLFPHCSHYLPPSHTSLKSPKYLLVLKRYTLKVIFVGETKPEVSNSLLNRLELQTIFPYPRNLWNNKAEPHQNSNSCHRLLFNSASDVLGPWSRDLVPSFGCCTLAHQRNSPRGEHAESTALCVHMKTAQLLLQQQNTGSVITSMQPWIYTPTSQDIAG